MDKVTVTDADVYAAAIQWCGEKDRETFPEDVQYFECNWRSLSGFRARVETLARHREQSIAPYREALEKIRDGKIEAMMMAAAKAHDANVTERETGAASALRCANGIATPYWRAIVQAVIRSHQKIARTTLQQGAE